MPPPFGSLRARLAVSALQLRPDELRVRPVSPPHQLIVRPDLRHLPVHQHPHAVRASHRAQPVRDDDGGATHPRPFQRLRHQPLRPRVQRARRLVEQQHRRVREQHPGDGDALALPPAERRAPFAHGGIVPVWKVFDETVRVGRRRRRLDLRATGARSRVRYVLRDGAGEQRRVLGHGADVTAEPEEVVRAHRDAVDPDRALVWIVKALQQVNDGALTPAGRTHERERLAGRKRQREPFEDHLTGPRGVGEDDVVEVDGAAERRVFRRVFGGVLEGVLILRTPPAAPSRRPIFDGILEPSPGARLDDLRRADHPRRLVRGVDPARDLRVDFAQLRQRARHLERERHHRGQLPNRHRPSLHQRSAVPQPRRHRRGRDRGEQREVQGVDAGGGATRLRRLEKRRVVPIQLGVFPRERANGSYTRETFRGDGRGPLL
mmetsp:Transcript_299/g.1277  ORF Transcript_299/g.1277 Transcript_299/m.1277 type:complete len:434 (+) Transcript_299:101-1402(+)